jgi:hypothetical protein
VPTYKGSGEGEGKGSPLIFKFNSRALLVCSSLAWPKQLPRPQQEGVGVGVGVGGFLVFTLNYLCPRFNMHLYFLFKSGLLMMDFFLLIFQIKDFYM